MLRMRYLRFELRSAGRFFGFGEPEGRGVFFGFTHNEHRSGRICNY